MAVKCLTVLLPKPPCNIFTNMGALDTFFSTIGGKKKNRLPFSKRGFESREVCAARLVGIAENTGGTAGGEM